MLVDGDDHNEPIADATRGILDGHIVMERAIAERGRYPAINILRSISRTMPGCNTEDENLLVTRARQLMATYDDMAELIRLGAYRMGSDPKVDEAIRYPIRTERDGDEMEPCVIAGPTCDSADVLYEKNLYPLPVSLTIGDEVLIEGTGAYTTTYSAVAFNGFDPLKAYII